MFIGIKNKNTKIYYRKNKKFSYINFKYILQSTD